MASSNYNPNRHSLRGAGGRFISIQEGAKAGLISLLSARPKPQKIKIPSTKVPAGWQGVENVDAFAFAMEKCTERMLEDGVEFLQDVTTDLYAGITERTPVLTGMAVTNWQIAVGGNFNADVLNPSERGASRQKALLTIMSIKDFSQPPVIYNNVNYIGFLEAGWSRKAPSGMIAPTLAEVSEKYGGYVDALDKAVGFEDAPDGDYDGYGGGGGGGRYGSRGNFEEDDAF